MVISLENTSPYVSSDLPVLQSMRKTS